MSVSKAALLGACAAACFAAGAVAQSRFPYLDSAQAALASALQSLDSAPDRFGGHKTNAQRLIREAQHELTTAAQSFR